MTILRTNIVALRKAFNNCGQSSFVSSALVDDILEVFPDKTAPIYITNETVRKKYKRLRVDMCLLVVKMNESEDPEVVQYLVFLFFF